MKQIIVVHPSTSRQTVTDLKKAGYVVIKNSNPASVKIIAPVTEQQLSDIVMSALPAVVNSGAMACYSFTSELLRRMQSQAAEKSK